MPYDWQEYNIGEFDEEALEKQETAFSGGLYIGNFRFYPGYAFFRSGMAPLVFPLNADGKTEAKAQADAYNDATGETRKVLSVRVLECDAEEVLNRETEWAPSRIVPGFADAWRACLKPSMQEHGLPTNSSWARWLCVAMVQDPGDTRTEEERTKPDGTVERPRTTFKVARVYNDEAEAQKDADLFIEEGADALGLSIEDTTAETPTTAAKTSGPKKPDTPMGDWSEYPDDWEKEVRSMLAERAESFAEEIKGKPSPIKKAALAQAYTDIAIALGAEAHNVEEWDKFFKSLLPLIE